MFRKFIEPRMIKLGKGVIQNIHAGDDSGEVFKLEISPLLQSDEPITLLLSRKALDMLSELCKRDSTVFDKQG